MKGKNNKLLLFRPIDRPYKFAIFEVKVFFGGVTGAGFLII